MQSPGAASCFSAAYPFFAQQVIHQTVQDQPDIRRQTGSGMILLAPPGACDAGRGRQVIAVCKSADLLLMVLDASKPDVHREILTRELESVGIRLNRSPPNIYFKKKKTGGISFNAVVPLTHLDEKMCQRVLQVSAVLSLCCNCLTACTAAPMLPQHCDPLLSTSYALSCFASLT